MKNATVKLPLRWGPALGLASCPLSYVISTALFHSSLEARIFWPLLALGIAWLSLELFLGLTRPFQFTASNPRWVSLTRGLWLLGPWVCWWDRAHSLTSFPVSPAAQIGLLAAGWMGLALRAGSILQLGRAFTYAVEVPDETPLRTRGLYRWLRHPSFTGLLVLTNLLGWVTGSLVGILLLASTVPNVVLRISQEEAELERRFGDAYRVYRRRSYRLIPLLY
jgi:protein-S-isoprenylcysteine O-methyltransferase Ste14